MRSFQAVILFLFALCAMVYAESDTTSYDSTVYVTSTIYRVNTVTASGTPPAVPAVNSTSTIAATYASATASFSGNATTVKPTGTGVSSPTTSPFTGAASDLTVNGGFALILAAGLGLLAL